MLRRSLITIALLGASLAAAPAWTQQPIVGVAMSTNYSANVRITAVDPSARTVTVAYSNGAVAIHKVSQAVANLAAVKVGDTVSVSFDDTRTFVLSGPNTPTPADRSASTTVAVGSSAGAAGASADFSIANWWVTSVDPAAGKVSVVDPSGGMIRTYTVTDIAARQQLPRIKPGDNLTAINSSIVVASITPRA